MRIEAVEAIPVRLPWREVLRAPFGRTVIMLARGRSRIHPGDYAYVCGNMETAQRHTA